MCCSCSDLSSFCNVNKGLGAFVLLDGICPRTPSNLTPCLTNEDDPIASYNGT